MNIYYIYGIRHQTVSFGKNPDEAVSQALDNGEIGDWEMPTATKILLPTGYALRPTRQSVELLAAIMEAAWTQLIGWIEGLTDDEFFWEPVSDCWTVHPDENGRWQVDYALPEPAPSPFTTIGWRIVHIASCKIMYHEYAFGPGQLTWDELPVPHTVAKAITWLEEGQYLLQGDLQRLDDAGLEKMVRTNWGDMWPTWRIFRTMAQHDLHHGAEIGCLRDLYRAKPGPKSLGAGISA